MVVEKMMKKNVKPFVFRNYRPSLVQVRFGRCHPVARRTTYVLFVFYISTHTDFAVLVFSARDAISGLIKNNTQPVTSPTSSNGRPPPPQAAGSFGGGPCGGLPASRPPRSHLSPASMWCDRRPRPTRDLIILLL